MKEFIYHLKKQLKIPFVMFLVFAICTYLFYLQNQGYDWANWTGLKGKTLWDLWVLFIPIGITIALAYYAHNLTMDNQREMILQNYFDVMTKLLLDKNLKKSKLDDEVREIARVKTLTTVKRLDGKRKGAIIAFLCESELIQKINSNEPIISLALADLEGVDLEDAYLNGSNRMGAFLRVVDSGVIGIGGYHLEGVYLTGAILRYANLRNAHLEDAHLDGANLWHANLRGSYLYGANLIGADLRGVILPHGQKFNPMIHTIEKLTERK